MRLPSQRLAGAIGAASAAVLIVSMFLDWYRLDLPSRVGPREINVPTYNAFEGLERSDVYLVVAAVLAIVVGALLVARVFADSPAPAVLLLAAGLFTLAVVIYRGTSRPGRLLFGETIDTTLRFGWVIALVAAGTMALAGLFAYLAGPRLQFDAGMDEEAEPDSEGVAGDGERDSRGRGDARAEE
jgi:hypothetical protein